MENERLHALAAKVEAAAATVNPKDDIFIRQTFAGKASAELFPRKSKYKCNMKSHIYVSI